ncbi:hypothetical protein [Marinobacter sp. S6332]|uniref:hypothetical protein n=1 Tax=Marinobacter sp. S6332 TaxID=2926403 RepID=UPI001FF4EEB7|nr:hypothetical protein [Marinobacter sp. S6332]MCK0162676.1 hypothetical protein [Marinobacter sp. S6332]
MKSMFEAKRLAAALAAEFGCGDLHINVQMECGEDWLNIDMYQNASEPGRLLAPVNCGAEVGLMNESTTLH